MADKDFSERIKDLRTNCGMTQSEFAEYFDIPVITVRNWENNYRSPSAYIINLIEKVIILENENNSLKNYIYTEITKKY